MEDPTVTIEELSLMGGALAMAVNMDFMSRDHGKIIWRKLLKLSNLDIKSKKKEKDDTIKKG